MLKQPFPALLLDYFLNGEKEVQNVKFIDSENKIEYIRWYAGSDSHVKLRDAAANGYKNPISIVIEEPQTKMKVQYDQNGNLIVGPDKKPIKVPSDWKQAIIKDYNMTAEFV